MELQRLPLASGSKKKTAALWFEVKKVVFSGVGWQWRLPILVIIENDSNFDAA